MKNTETTTVKQKPAAGSKRVLNNISFLEPHYVTC